MKKLLLILIALCVMQGCKAEIPDLKSPCVGAQGSPCDNRTPVNTWLG